MKREDDIFVAYLDAAKLCGDCACGKKIKRRAIQNYPMPKSKETFFAKLIGFPIVPMLLFLAFLSRVIDGFDYWAKKFDS